MSEQDADIQRNISLLLGDDRKGSGAVSADGEKGSSGVPVVRLRSLERIRVYRIDGSSYSVPYSDVDRVELSADGQELSLLLRGGVHWHMQGESLQHLADLLDMHAVGALQVTPSIADAVHYRITNVSEQVLSDKQSPVINIPKRG
jgi:hypothetical protein